MDKEAIPELSFRICALRETFEESGILLVHDIRNGNPSSSPFQLETNLLGEWRTKVHNDASQFLNLMKYIGQVPSVFALHEWSCWLTPTFFKGKNKRFDTIFFAHFVDENLPEFSHDGKEVEELKVVDPFSLLQSYYDGQLSLGPPQVYELLRIANFKQFEHFRQYCEERGRKGIERWMPEKVVATDGVLSVLPGDDLYPSEPDYYGQQQTKSLANTLEELRNTSEHIHRIQVDDPKNFRLSVHNIVPRFGHQNPLQFRR